MGDFFRRYVAHNFLLKLLSLALAAGLWLAVTRNPIAEVPVTVPIEFHHIPNNLEIVSETIPQAQVRVRGPERIVRRVTAAEVHVEVDLAGAKPGERTFDLTAQQVHEPRELEVVQVVPSQVHLDFDTRLTREVEIHPRVTGTFARGLRLARAEANPSSIRITGPKQRVAAVDAATTDPVDATGTVGSASFMTHAYVSDPLVQVVRPEPVRVTVIVEKEPGGNAGR
ncbi:MAG TPA: CdaR family protein [Terriglobales bacterium]|nr:CdaR family protein [Terriglobales bacterium]